MRVSAKWELLSFDSSRTAWESDTCEHAQYEKEVVRHKEFRKKCSGQREYQVQ